MQFFFVSVVSLVLQNQKGPQLQEGRIGDEEEAQIAKEKKIKQVGMIFLSFRRFDVYLFHVFFLPFHFQMLSGKHDTVWEQVAHMLESQLCSFPAISLLFH